MILKVGYNFKEKGFIKILIKLLYNLKRKLDIFVEYIIRRW